MLHEDFMENNFELHVFSKLSTDWAAKCAMVSCNVGPASLEGERVNTHLNKSWCKFGLSHLVLPI